MQEGRVVIFSPLAGASARLEHALRRCRKLGELRGRPSGTGREFAAAIRAPILQGVARAGPAEGALERADERFLALGWQIAVAAFAIGTKLEHSLFLLVRA